ncbi:hypothetical protein PtrM4_044730 [Pyrenophora tritici-repentis]|nr:hypothetical protein PtrM4_044730 [Pyrenophora tritici-repentis]
MVYKDDDGVEHAIRIRLGQFQIACQHYINEDWDALGKFPQRTETSEQS